MIYDHYASRRIWWNHKWAMKMYQYVREGRLSQEIVKWRTNLRWKTKMRRRRNRISKLCLWNHEGNLRSIHQVSICRKKSCSEWVLFYWPDIHLPSSSNKATLPPCRAMSSSQSHQFSLSVREKIGDWLWFWSWKLHPTQLKPQKLNGQELLELLRKANSLFWNG